MRIEFIVLILDIHAHALLESLIFEHSFLLFLLFLSVLLIDLLLELLLHLKTLLVLFALDHIFFISTANQNTTLLFEIEIKSPIKHSPSCLDRWKVLLCGVI